MACSYGHCTTLLHVCLIIHREGLLVKEDFSVQYLYLFVIFLSIYLYFSKLMLYFLKTIKRPIPYEAKCVLNLRKGESPHGTAKSYTTDRFI